MVKTKKSKSKFNVSAIIVFAISLVMLISSITFAWFTSISNAGNETLEFGTINVTATSNDLVTAVSPGTNKTTLLMPKDNLTISYTIKNEGEAAYFISKVSITAEAEDATIQALAGTYIASGNTKSGENQVGAMEKGAADIEMTHTASVPEDLSNDFQGKTVTIGVTVYAIQQENLTAAEAYTKIMEMIDANSVVLPEDGYVHVDDQNIHYTYKADKGGYVIATIEFEEESPNIISYGASQATGDIVIPGEIDGVPVVEIESCSFGNYNGYNGGSAQADITSIVFEEGIKTINRLSHEMVAIGSCSSIILPQSLETLGQDAFSYLPLETLIIPKNVKNISSYVISESESLMSIYIDSEAFALNRIWHGGGCHPTIYINKDIPENKIGDTIVWDEEWSPAGSYDRDTSLDTEDYYAYS